MVRLAVGEVCSGFYFLFVFLFFSLCGLDLATVPVGLAVSDMRFFVISFFAIA